MDEQLDIVKTVALAGGTFQIVKDRFGEFYWIAADNSESDGPFESAEDAERTLPRTV